MQDKKLCAMSSDDMEKIFASRLKTKRRGASLLSLMVFFFAALVITAQVFFFSKNSAESVREDRDIQSVRMQLASVVEDIKILMQKGQKFTDAYVAGGAPTRRDYGLSFFNLSNLSGVSINCDNFYEVTRAAFPDRTAIADINPSIYFSGIHDTTSIDIHDLNYKYNATTWVDKPVNERIFPPMPNHYLIRVHRAMPAGNRFMLQVLVESEDKANGVFKTKTYEEIWY